MTTKQQLALLEKEHQWRELLQKQLGEHYLKIYYPEPEEKTLVKIRGQGGKVA
jgi:hypothetical protein